MIEIRYEENNHRSVAYEGEDMVGECTYYIIGEVWAIDHTFVNSAYAGQGIAGKLVDEVLGRARERGVKVIPVCSYVKRVFEKKPEYRDLLCK
ncbi:MAG TPA: GNAT family N-acetyltransferase [Lachnospiraceae bacterium]